jgi:nucleoside-diphosphate-sugar epimerase
MVNGNPDDRNEFIPRAREILKWRPEIGLEEGLQRTMS